MESAEDAATTASSGGSRLGKPLVIAATFAAGAGAALAAKSVIESRREGGADKQPGTDRAGGEDLVTTLRRAALDVAVAATNEAAERLSVDDKSEEGQSR